MMFSKPKPDAISDTVLGHLAITADVVAICEPYRPNQ